MRIPPLFYVIVLALVVCLTGCDQKITEDIEIPSTPAHDKLRTLLAEEYDILAYTRAFDNTLFIYIPLEKPFLSIGSSKEGPQKSEKRNASVALHYFDGTQIENNLLFKYDIGNSISYSENNGIITEFDDIYQSITQKLMSALTRAYGNIERAVDSYHYIERITGDRDFMDELAEEKRNQLVQSNVLFKNHVPDFIVYVVADITTGIAFKTTAYLQDLRRVYHYQDAGFTEEFQKRVITDQIGNKKIQGDKEGLFWDNHDVTWNEFLVKQIIHRVKFKYQRSDHKPKNTDPYLLQDLAMETLQAYPFRSYNKVVFENMEDGKSFSFTKSEVPPYKHYEPKKKDDNLRTIKFDAGKHL